MKAVLSPLVLKDFAIVESRFEFIPQSDDVNDIEVLFNAYSIDLDFEYSKNEHFIANAVRIMINHPEDSNKLAGYSLMVEGTSIFEFKDSDELTLEDKASLINYSGLSITINQIRGFITALTSYAPFGRYNLPTIDVNDLLSQKHAIMEKEKESDSK